MTLGAAAIVCLSVLVGLGLVTVLLSDDWRP